MRIRWPRRVFAQVLTAQVALTTGVMVLATGLFLAPLSSELDDQAMRRALSIAQTTAAAPDLARELVTTEPAAHGPVQAEAERIRTATGALYVVVMDTHGVRWSHTHTDEIGRHVSTDPSRTLAGRQVRQIDTGTLGRSARAKVPLRDDRGRIVGAVSVGIAYDSVRGRLFGTIPALLRYAGAALAVGVLAAVALSRRLRRRTHGVAFADISALLDEREAMLHGIREGVVAFDRRGRIRLVNDEAARLLGLDARAAGRALDEVLPPGRTTDVLAGRVDGTDLLAVSGGRVLVANRMPTQDGGAVVTLRDRTELELLGRELDGTQGLLDALRAQDHEHANQLHTLRGLLELGRYERAVEFVSEVASAQRASAEQIAERVHDPLLSALLVGKAAVAAERGVSLRVSSTTLLPDAVVDPRDLVTVLGNLIDNALDATGERRRDEPFVEVELRAEHTTAVLRVSDTGPGVPPELRERIFAEGWSTKAAARAPGTAPSARPVAFHRGRGIGLALVRRLAERYGGMARVTARAGGGAVFTVVLPEALARHDDAPVRRLTTAGEPR
ncbi:MULTISPECIES: sensor histidine kinase [unclassified Streptomyces]|uniref:sensor histidine kinase n=1 Tax=unclassified Streptomyces TaxID=2593676 RepID=UPI000887526A|nr:MULTISPECIES: sensor histidine kinase [unclassified Streptomyces]PBC80755.1 two-component system CitB family sensor kinase [Streptomyces sp. 2321.6]SDR57414.1 two-component system, CitB family, sensor kinase [Streptomyces sp. KS_16]SEB87289.1 two-component system, CitB family, sensor kinase [Streptomyces sp. 2133.1]SNC61996.1 two-component system, CitB family, sensor kinase [Streptomyces sp. 2114.4]